MPFKNNSYICERLIKTRLYGKHKVTFTPHVDCGDYVIIINASKVKLTGNKLNNNINNLRKVSKSENVKVALYE